MRGSDILHLADQLRKERMENSKRPTLEDIDNNRQDIISDFAYILAQFKTDPGYSDQAFLTDIIDRASRFQHQVIDLQKELDKHEEI